jgi:hypothetical protein
MPRLPSADGAAGQALPPVANYDAIHDNVATKADLDRLGSVLRSELAIALRDLKISIGSLILGAGGALFAALHYWPPHP